MFWKARFMGEVVWEYLNQPVFGPPHSAVWKPSRFLYVYKIHLLEHCWQISSSKSRSNS